MFQTNVGKATVEVLERLGCEIVFLKLRFVAGNLHITGYVKNSKEPMKKMIETFKDAE